MFNTSGLNARLNLIYFYLNEGYNLACRVCWAREKASAHPGSVDRRTGNLDLSLVRQAIEEARPLGLKSVTLTGGEPLLHPQFDQILDLVEQIGLKVHIETGGAGVTPERAARIAGMDRADLAIGLEGVNAETHDRLRGQPGSFEQATQAARMFAKAGMRPQITFSLVKENAAQIGELIPLAEELGAWSVRFFLIHPPSTAPVPRNQEGPTALEVEELIAIGRRVERELASTTRLRLFYDQPPAFRGLNPQGPTEVHRRCNVLNALSVMPGGFYALCGIGYLAPELTFGRVGVDSLEKIWRENPTLRFLRDGMPNQLAGVCDRCVMKNHCLGNCVVQNYMNTGTFWGPFWFCEAAERASLFPASRLRENSVW